MISFLKAIKSYIPNWYLYGSEYRKTYKFLIESQKWTTTQNQEYQLQKLKSLVSYCYENVPYYNDLFDKHAISPNINSFEDFKKIPYLTKEKIINDSNKLVSKKTKVEQPKIHTTGGRTGIALKFYKSQLDAKIKSTYVNYALSQMGS